MKVELRAAFDDEGVYVYQAFKPEIVSAALKTGTFSKGFSLERMTWIKPSFGWMLYRSKYATKHRQEAILRVKISHEGFKEILQKAIPTHHNPAFDADVGVWRRRLKVSEVRVQWDPDRDPFTLHKLERRAIQLGIRGGVVQSYVGRWILGLEDVTSLARAIKERQRKIKGLSLPELLEERIYPLEEGLRRHLGVKENS